MNFGCQSIGFPFAFLGSTIIMETCHGVDFHRFFHCLPTESSRDQCVMVAAGGRQFEYSFMDYSPESSPELENGPDNGFEFQEFSREQIHKFAAFQFWTFIRFA